MYNITGRQLILILCFFPSKKGLSIELACVSSYMYVNTLILSEAVEKWMGWPIFAVVWLLQLAN